MIIADLTTDDPQAPANVDAWVRKYAGQYQVPEQVVRRIIDVESAGNPGAVSKKGAIGLMQLMPGTAKDLGVDPFDPEQNIHGGVKYFRQMLDRFGDQELALAAYNAGPGAVARYGGVPPFRETQNYVNRVLSYRDAYTSR